MDDTQHTESVNDLINSIEKKEIVLPEFQRDFVWDIGKTYDLFDSMIREIFIGALIYGIPSFEFTIRSLDTRPRKGEGSRIKLDRISLTKSQIEFKVKTANFRLVLDGQQRITSIYRALKGIDEVWFIVKDTELSKDPCNDFKTTLEKAISEFCGQEDENKLSIKISDVYKMLSGTIRRENEKRQLFEELIFIKKTEDKYKDQYFNIYLCITELLQDLFKSQKFLSYYLLNMNSEKFALFFERSNSKGIQLGFIDILTAKLYNGFNLREKINSFKENNPTYYLKEEIIVRTIAYIKGEGKKDIDRSYILLNLNSDDFNAHWDNICELYIKVLNFLFDNHFIISQEWMPYDNMLIPLIIFRNEIRGDFDSLKQSQIDFIKYWYWSSIFSIRYTGSSNEMIIMDSNILKMVAKNEKIKNKNYFNRLKKIIINNIEDILSFSKKGSAVYKGILNLMNYCSKGLLNWENTSNLTFNSELDDHHIFPKAFLNDKYDDSPELIDCVANRTLIPKLTNIKIGKNKPSVYLNELLKGNSELHTSLKTHLISDNILSGDYDAFYENFLKDRAMKILDQIKQCTINMETKISSIFYEEIKTDNINIYAIYKEKLINATFNKETNEVFYNNKKYQTPSAAAKAAIIDISGNIKTSRDGWEFWKYKSDEGIDQDIDIFRKNN